MKISKLRFFYLSFFCYITIESKKDIMAKISRKDLEHLSNEEIREVLLVTTIPDVINNYYNDYQNDGGYFSNAQNRVNHLLNVIIIDRFINNQI